jgi:hypothetical protein
MSNDLPTNGSGFRVLGTSSGGCWKTTVVASTGGGRRAFYKKNVFIQKLIIIEKLSKA